MGFPIDSKVLGLREVIKVNEGESYRIPIYQRPYSWEEKNIKDFLESIFDAFKEVNKKDCKTNAKPVFFGTIQLDRNKEDKNTLDIVDGQQRLTTFLLFLDVLQRNEKHPKEYIDCSMVIDSEKLKEVLNDNIKKDSSKYYENRKLLKEEVEHFEKEFKDKNEFYTELKNFVLDNVYFVQLITEEMDLSEVVSVFNTINTTGLDLNATDIFKVRYYNYLRGIDNTKDWLKEINSCYQSIDDSNEKLGKDGRTDQTKFDMGWVLDIYKHIICAECFKWFKECSADEIIRNIKSLLWSPVRSNEYNPCDDFYKTIQYGLFDNGSRVHLVCTLTALIDEVDKEVKESDIYECFFNYEMIRDPYDIEHIEARNNFKDNVDEFNGIGNLTVLERSINRGIKDKPVIDKLVKYEDSKYASVKAVRQEILDKHKGKWDIDCVGKRAEAEIIKIKSFMKGE